ncbi:MAG: SHOCT domain-containing protein [Clostridia bacterium]|nr:SHOCT domain-containing protein [Clostridia bacterium]
MFTAGTNLKIQTLSTTEAERVVEIYNLYKRLAREEAKKPIIVQQAEKAIDPLEQLEKLQKLKDAGVITEEEFATKKADLLAKL